MSIIILLLFHCCPASILGLFIVLLTDSRHMQNEMCWEIAISARYIKLCISPLGPSFPCMYTCMHVHTLYMHTHTHVRTNTHSSAHTHTHTHTNKHTHTQTYTHTHTHTHTHHYYPSTPHTLPVPNKPPRFFRHKAKCLPTSAHTISPPPPSK